MRRILIILIVLLLAGFGVWYFFFRQTTDTGALPGTGDFFPSAQPGGMIGGGDIGIGTPGAAGTVTSSAVPKLAQLTSGPVAGFTIFSLSRSVTIPSADPAQKPVVTTVIDHVLRYVSRANGYVYEVKNADAPLQITNISIPNIYEASFADTNKTVLLRFLRTDNRTIATYSVPIPAENVDGTRTQSSGSYLPDNMLSYAVSPDTRSVARLFNAQDSGIIQTSTSTNTAVKELLRSPFREWLLSWPVQATVYAQTKASASVPGYLYAIDASDPRLRRVLGDIDGLTASVSPNGAYALYSQSAGNGFTASIHNMRTGAAAPLNLAILPEKCAWIASDNLICAGNSAVAPAKYPDSWYAGVTHFSDQLYMIYTATNSYDVLYDGSTRSIDMTNLRVDELQGIVYFIDKNDGTLWRFDY